MKCEDIKTFCDRQGVKYALIKCGASYLLAVPTAASSEIVNFLDTNGVQHSRPCSIVKDFHDIYLYLDG